MDDDWKSRDPEGYGMHQAWLKRFTAEHERPYVSPSPQPVTTPTYTKVTEVVGRFFANDVAEEIECEGWPFVTVLGHAIPSEANSGTLLKRGPRGRFRITVEFTPEESDAGT